MAYNLKRQKNQDMADGWEVSPVNSRGTAYYIRRVKAKYVYVADKRVKVSDGGTFGINDVAALICNIYKKAKPQGSALPILSVKLVLSLLPTAIVEAIANGNVVKFKDMGTFEAEYTSDMRYFEGFNENGKLQKHYYPDYVTIHFKPSFSKARCAEMGKRIADEIGGVRESVRAAKAKQKAMVDKRNDNWIQNQRTERENELNQHKERIFRARNPHLAHSGGENTPQVTKKSDS